jgi:HAD superfamily hydrolase (TIGR01509 family)
MRLKYRTVFFDLDDTLFDHQRHRRDALIALRQAAGLADDIDVLALERAHDRHQQLTEQRLMAGELSLAQARLERLRGTLREFGTDAGDEQLLALENIYVAAYEREWTTVPGAIELLHALRQAGARLVLITNGRVQNQYPKLERLGLRAHLDEVLVSEEVGCEKPSMQFFQLALARGRCRANEGIVVGDLWHTDILGAHQMGMAAIWLNRYGYPRGPLAQPIEITSYVPLEQTLRLFVQD